MIVKAYVSGPLTGIDNLESLKKFYVDIARVCAGEKIDAYVPHLFTDPVKNPAMTARDVYEIDREKVVSSDLVIAYVGAPSLGVGIEIEIACENNVPVLLLMENAAQVSRMARGNPGVAAEIRFQDFDDALIQLSTWLHNQEI